MKLKVRTYQKYRRVRGEEEEESRSEAKPMEFAAKMQSEVRFSDLSQ